MKKVLLISFGFILTTVCGYSQDQHLIDSLQTKLKQLEGERTELRDDIVSLRDSSSARVLNDLGIAFMNNDPRKALDLAKQSLALSEQIGWMKGAGNAHRIVGVIYNQQGNFPGALKNHLASIEISKKIGDKNGIGKGYGNIGGIYFRQGNYPEALKKQYACLKILEELEDKKGVAAIYISVGNTNGAMGNYPEALKFFSSALKIAKELNDNRTITLALGNIGTVYSKQGNYPPALKNYAASLKMAEQTGNKSGISNAYSHIGTVYLKQGNCNNALKNYFASLIIREELKNNEGVAICYANIGAAYINLNRASEGRNWLQKALLKAQQIGSKEIIQNSYSGLASADSALGDLQKAFENYKLSIVYRDSLLNNENTKKITQQQMQYEFDKKEALTKAEQEKKDAVAIEEIENQKLVRNGFMGGFATVLIFAGTFFIQRNKIKKEKKRNDNLLRNILPDEVAEELKETGGSKAKAHEMVSVMFTDFKDFTKISETVSAEMLVDELHECFSAFDNILHKHNIEKIKTIGDAYMCVSGLPVSSESHATDMVKAAIDIMDYAIARKKEKDAKGEFAFELRIGINSGPVVAGIVGLKKFSYDIWGDTVNTAARMEHQGEAGKVNISGTTYEMIKDKFPSTHRGKITAKNKGEIDMYFIDQSVNINSPLKILI